MNRSYTFPIDIDYLESGYTDESTIQTVTNYLLMNGDDFQEWMITVVECLEEASTQPPQAMAARPEAAMR